MTISTLEAKLLAGAVKPCEALFAGHVPCPSRAGPSACAALGVEGWSGSRRVLVRPVGVAPCARWCANALHDGQRQAFTKTDPNPPYSGEDTAMNTTPLDAGQVAHLRSGPTVGALLP